MVTAHIGPGLRASVRTLGEEYAQARQNILPENQDYLQILVAKKLFTLEHWQITQYKRFQT